MTGTEESGASSSRRARVLAVVPAWNEEKNVPGVVRELLALAERPDVLVVDDGSTDRTGAAARAAGARVLTLPYNSGIGATVQAGIAWGVERGYAVIARFDGDGQHAPSFLGALSAALAQGDADFVLGSRYLAEGGFRSTWTRRLGSRWFSFLLRVLTGERITDPTSGCWAVNGRAARVLEAEYASDYPEVDSLVRLRRAGCRIREIPIVMRARLEGRSSIDAVRAVYYMFKVTIALVIGRVETRAQQGGGTP
ncbi:MAG TPA: glycosyltransferase family 2 protein [Polyangiaceae bacterium]|nr:glycosyltransferase family 2 protein [Polyangiaceae bacterium]